jgi:predicted AAA+ superfamily ATPase
MQYIERIVDREIKELLAGVGAISIEGPKGVGKTETAKQVAATVKELDHPAVKAIGEADINQLLVGKRPVLLDEWQHIPAVWDAVRRHVDQHPNPGAFLLTGSASPLTPPTHSGAGRVVTLRMRPLGLSERNLTTPTISFAQLLQGRGCSIEGSTDVGLQTYVQEIVRSGFPGIRPLQGRPLRAQLSGYVRRILDRDLVELGASVRNPERVLRWMTAYAAATATTATFEVIRAASTAGDGQTPAKTTVQSYRDALQRIWVIDPVPAWLPSHNLLGELAQPPKHHLADPALAANLLGLGPESLLAAEEQRLQPQQGTILGNLFESLVTLSIRVLAQDQEATVKHLRTKRGTVEIDLIVERPDKKILAIEVKLSQSVRDDDVRHLLWLKNRIGPDLVDTVVINTGPKAYRRPDGVAVIPAALLGL